MREGYVDGAGIIHFDDDVIGSFGCECIEVTTGNNGVECSSKATTLELKPDPVNHPSHYETGCGFECIDVLLETQGEEAVKGFCLCNAMKYLYRHGRKNGLEDVRKARWYLDRYITMEEGQQDGS